MGKRSQFKKLGLEVSIRVKLAKEKLKNEFQAGALYGEGLKLFRKMKPMGEHIDSGKCEYCTIRFVKLKNDPEILALPEGSDKRATEIILNNPELRRTLKEIIDCPKWRDQNAAKL